MRARSFFLAILLTIIVAMPGMAADTYSIDPVHSKVGFAVRHMVISNVEGRFTDFAGTIVYDEEDPAKSSVRVTIKVASINTDNQKRDAHLKSPEFFDVEKYPEITFVSKKVSKTDDGFVAVGDLTIRDMTREIELPFVIHGVVQDPWGNTRLGAEADVTVNRLDYGMTWSKKLDSGGLVLGEKVKIHLAVEAVKQKNGTN